MSDDRDLVTAVLARTPGAFERLVARHQNLVWHLVYRMVQHPELEFYPPLLHPWFDPLKSDPRWEAEALSHLRIANLKMALVINFGERSLRTSIRRVMNV